MEEALNNAVQELKRVDHLFYVSLKYTRTVDMMRHMIERLISTIDFGTESLLKHAKENKLIASIPSNAGLRSELVKKDYETTKNFIKLVKKTLYGEEES